jgi:demethylmenaquinone methyltransferase/2-methoxy-6-polyprenyl-1,4-benzoquinol methylase
MKYYDQISKSYNELHGQEQLNKLRIIKENLDIRKDNLLLDVGCGTGISSQFDCNVISLDPSIQLLNFNKNKNKFLGIAEKLPFKDNTFDIVVSMTAIHNFKDIEKSLKEMKRVGKGEFVFSILKKSDKFNKIEKLIKKHFKINKLIEEEKDVIFFCD